MTMSLLSVWNLNGTSLVALFLAFLSSFYYYWKCEIWGFHNSENSSRDLLGCDAL